MPSRFSVVRWLIGSKARTLQLVAEQVEPKRLLGAGREQVDDAAADRELARLPHGLRAGIAVVGQIGLQPVQVDAVADAGAEGGMREGPRGGTFWSSALTVVSTSLGRPLPGSIRRVSPRPGG